MRRLIAGMLVTGLLILVPALRIHAASDDAAPPPGLDAALAALDLSDDDAVLTELEALVDEGNAYAPQVLGAMYQYGFGVAEDDCRAFEFFRLAVALGNVRAEADVAGFYSRGECVARDLDIAKERYEAAIADGDMTAQNSLAWLYLEDDWPLRDAQTALRLAREAYERAPTVRARADSARAYAMLYAMLYKSGKGVKRDLGRMEALLREAAELGDRFAQLLLVWAMDERGGNDLRRDEIVMWLVLHTRQVSSRGDIPPDAVSLYLADEYYAAEIYERARAAARAKFDEIAANPNSLLAEAIEWCSAYRPESTECRWYAVSHDARCGMHLDDVYRRWGLEQTRYFKRCRAEALAESKPVFKP